MICKKPWEGCGEEIHTSTNSSTLPIYIYTSSIDHGRSNLHMGVLLFRKQLIGHQNPLPETKSGEYRDEWCFKILFCQQGTALV